MAGHLKVEQVKITCTKVPLFFFKSKQPAIYKDRAIEIAGGLERFYRAETIKLRKHNDDDNTRLKIRNERQNEPKRSDRGKSCPFSQ